jgi:hypothetical protein
MKLVVVVAVLAVACTTAKPLGPLVRLPADTPQECARLCETMGLQLTAVVVVASTAGCVCEAHPGTARPSGAAAAASGGAVVAAQAAAAAQQRQQQQSGALGH